jgi:hypothetical protein
MRVWHYLEEKAKVTIFILFLIKREAMAKIVFQKPD